MDSVQGNRTGRRADSDGPRLLNKRTVARRYDVSCKTIDRRVRAGLLPPPVTILRRHFWPETVIDDDQRRLLQRGMAEH
jgi:predicted DNA-binding transcriptional regulator AlpA